MFFVVEVFTQVTKCFFEVRGLIRQPAHARLSETHKLLYTSARRPPPQRPSSHGGPPGPRSSKFRVAEIDTMHPAANGISQSRMKVPMHVEYHARRKLSQPVERGPDSRSPNARRLRTRAVL